MATIDYKEKYEKAVHAAMLAKQDTESAVTVQTLEEIFPELRESEDERIRKEILTAFSSGHDNSDIYGHGITYGQVRAWLEKQGNLMKALQISNAKIGELTEKNYYLKEQLEKQGKNNMGISEATKHELEDNLNKALEKETQESCNKFLDEQGEQKPVIEMKTPEESLGIYSDTYNKIVDECVYDEPKFKYGDRVRNKKSGLEQTLGSCIEDVYEGAFPFRIKDQDYWELVEQKPAEVGPRQEQLTKFEKAVKQVLEEAIECGDTHNLKADADMLLRLVQKSAWSEEDEENLNWFEKLFRAESVIAGGKDIPQDRYLWFKSLKDRVQPQPKQEWSEEDENGVEYCLYAIKETFKGVDNPHRVGTINWLKSLKERYAWRPSYEQVSVLEFVMGDIEKDSIRYRVLNSVLEDLKKLREK